MGGIINSKERAKTRAANVIQKLVREYIDKKNLPKNEAPIVVAKNNAASFKIKPYKTSKLTLTHILHRSATGEISWEEKLLPSHSTLLGRGNMFAKAESEAEKLIAGIFAKQCKEELAKLPTTPYNPYSTYDLLGTIPCWAALKDHCKPVPTLKALSDRFEQCNDTEKKSILPMFKNISKGVTKGNWSDYKALFLNRKSFTERGKTYTDPLIELFKKHPIKSVHEYVSLGDFREQLMEFCGKKDAQLKMPHFTDEREVNLVLPKSRL